MGTLLFIEILKMRSTIVLACLCVLVACAPPASADYLPDIGSIGDSVADGVSTVYNYVGGFFWGEEEDCVWPAAFCNDYSCPHFVCQNMTSKYAVRRYDASSWVTTSLTDEEYYKDATSTMFRRLFGYITGDNDNEQSIDMTVPVLVGMIPTADNTGYEANFNMSFYLPMNDAPAPSNQDVQLNNYQATTVYVRKFGGFAGVDDYMQHAQVLREALPESTSYVESYFYAVGYNSPWWPLYGRRNEVWYIGA